MFTKSELLVNSLQKRSKRMSRLCLNSDLTLIAGCSVKYVDSDATLRNILQVCRDFNETLAPAVYKQALLRTGQANLAVKRQALWLKLLKIDPQFISGEFEAYLQQSRLDLSQKRQH